MEVGAILHDVGRSRTHNVNHGVVGGAMIREMGYSEALARIVDRHIGGGIPEKETREMGLPPGVYMPETLEEKTVAYADKLIAGRNEVDIGVTLDDFAEKLGWDHPAIVRLRNLHLEMAELLELDE